MAAPGGFSFANLVMGRDERLLEEGERNGIAPEVTAGVELGTDWIATDTASLVSESRRRDVATYEITDEDGESPDNVPSWSVQSARPFLYLPFCCGYNCFCCCWNFTCGTCKPFAWCGPPCGSEFWCKDIMVPWVINARPYVWLRALHTLCFLIHAAWVVVTIEGAWGHDMNVQIVRVKPEFIMPGKYAYGIAASPGIPQIRYDLLVASFFGLSALMHFVWVAFGGTKWAKRALWKNLDDCLCYWRWLECKPVQLKPFTHSTTHTVSAACDRLAFCQRHVWYTSAFEPVQYTLPCFSQRQP